MKLYDLTIGIELILLEQRPFIELLDELMVAFGRTRRRILFAALELSERRYQIRKIADAGPVYGSR